jgi:hypothetical protein
MSQFRSILQRICPVHQSVTFVCTVHKGASADCDLCREGLLNPWQLVHDAVKEDAAMRYPGVTGGLYGLDDVGLCGKLPHGVPMIRTGRFANDAAAATDEDFRDRLANWCTPLSDFNFKRHGLYVAGGAVSALLIGIGRDDFHDYDLFLVGHRTEASAREAIEAFRDHLMLMHRCGVAVYRTQGCITFLTQHEKPFQVVLRMYSTIAEVIHGFDLGSSALLWDGEKIWMTALGRLAIQYGANVLNLHARRASLEARIARYFGRGFDIVLPGLDVAEFAKTCRLPYLSAGGSIVDFSDDIDSDEDVISVGDDEAHSILSNKTMCICSVQTHTVHATRPGCDDRGYRVGESQISRDAEETSDYALHMTYGNIDRITLRNAVVLAHDEIRVAGLCAVGGENCDMFGIQPVLDIGVVRKIVSNCLESRQKILILPLIQLFGRAKAAEIVACYIMDGDIEVVHRLARERVITLNRRAVIPFAFMRVEENTSLTGPFPRYVLTPAQWYGSAYYPANVWRKTLDAAIALAQLHVTPYEMLWILQWVAPPLATLDEARVLRLLEKIREDVA